MIFPDLGLLFSGSAYTVLVKSCITLGGTFMLEGKENEEQHAIEELQTFTISESVKLKRAQRDKRNKEYEDKLKVLKEKTDQLKKELGYE